MSQQREMTERRPSDRRLAKIRGQAMGLPQKQIQNLHIQQAPSTKASRGEESVLGFYIGEF
jgi:hypothetical protein